MIIQDIKSRITCLEYAQRIGLPIKRSGGRTVSLSGGTNRTALVVYDDFFADFKADLSGDVIDLCAIYAHDGDRREAIRELARITGADSESYGDWHRYTQNLCNAIQKWHEQLRPEDREYLHGRRITDETIEKLKIGFNAGRIIIPYWKNGYVTLWIGRATSDDQNPKYLKPKNDDLKDYSAVWGLHTIKQNSDVLIICEGAFDALSFAQDGFPVLATMGGHFSKEQLKTVLSVCRQYQRVFLAFDNDDAGTGFTLRFSKLLFQEKIPFVTADIPPKYKDVSDYYTDGGSLQDLIETARNGLLGMTSRITDKNEFKAFAYQAGRFVGKPEMTELFNASRDRFPADWFNEVRKIALSQPTETMIAKIVMEKHRFKYLVNVGFYEYRRGVWNYIDDDIVHGYIRDELGHYATGGKLPMIARLIRVECVTTEPFDRQNVWNFINGTLELDSFNFREHRESDLCSIQMKYPYDPTACSEGWQTFIEQICNHDPRRMSLLQEMAGYVLYPNCPYEKIFALTGGGGNGKSRFMMALQALYGDENCSAVNIAGIMADFQRINLSRSVINIASEIKASFAGAEEYLKQIASGETISACFKGKNFINFKPRSKLIFACNGQISSKDTSDGLLRRLCIVDFECRFVDYPEKSNEFRKDVHILEKLLSNMPALFNWALEGYKMLRATNEFTVTLDQEKLLERFKEVSNPVYVFVKDFDFIGDITRNDLYAEYRSWCIRCGHNPKSQTSFIPEFRNVIGDRAEEFKKRIDGKVERGFTLINDSEEQLSI